jgi:hypothetical protein
MNRTSSVQGGAGELLCEATSEQVQCWNYHVNQESDKEHQLMMIEVALKDMDMDAIYMAIEAMVQRHESLRTYFKETNGVVTQYIAPYQKDLFMPAYHDIRPYGKDKKLVDVILDDCKRRLQKLDSLPLVQFCIFRFSEEDYYFCLVVHHIIFDGWSRRLFYNEMREFYESFLTRKEIGAMPPAMQLREYGKWQKEWWKEQGPSARDYWTRKLSFLYKENSAGNVDGILNSLDSGAAESYTGRIANPLYGRLKGLANRCKVSLVSVMISSFRLVFRLLTGNEKILIAMPAANRNCPGSESVIGYLTGGIYLYQPIREDLPLSDLISDSYLDLLKSAQYLIYDHVEMGVDESLLRSYSEIFVNFVGREMTGVSELREDGRQLQWAPEAFSYYALSCSITEYDDGLICVWKYNLELYSRDTIIMLMKMHRVLMDKMCDDPGIATGQLLKNAGSSSFPA